MAAAISHSRPPTARSVILDLLSTLRRGAMPVRALVETGASMGLAEGSVRVALTRLTAEGRVERDERGAYRLGEAARAVSDRLASWRRLEQRTGSWDGTWLAVIATRPAAGWRGAAASSRGLAGGSRTAQRRHRRALRWLGFRELERGVAIRPDNLTGGVDHARVELARLGLVPGAVVCRLSALDPVSDARARGLWDTEGLVAGYRRLARVLEESARRLPLLSEEEGRVESFRLGGEALRALVLDPLLPEPIVPGRERAALLETMRRYDALGRACWAPFLARHGVHHRRAPTDTHSLSRGELT